MACTASAISVSGVLWLALASTVSALPTVALRASAQTRGVENTGVARADVLPQGAALSRRSAGSTDRCCPVPGIAGLQIVVQQHARVVRQPRPRPLYETAQLIAAQIVGVGHVDAVVVLPEVRRRAHKSYQCGADTYYYYSSTGWSRQLSRVAMTSSPAALGGSGGVAAMTSSAVLSLYKSPARP